jgi:predicted nucleic acid-binding protein
VILLDTSGLLAAIDSRQHRHRDAAAALRAAEPPLVLSPFILAELDYLLATRVGAGAEVALLQEVGRGAYDLVAFEAIDVALAADLVERYADLDLGLADASIVVLADRLDTSNILTLDERHFRAVRRSKGDPLRLLPSDA